MCLLAAHNPNENHCIPNLSAFSILENLKTTKTWSLKAFSCLKVHFGPNGKFLKSEEIQSDTYKTVMSNTKFVCS